MSSSRQSFSDMEAEILHRGGDSALRFLAEYFLSEKRFHELFEIRKIQIRRRLGLPMLYRDTGGPLAEDARQQMEAQLLSACREVGTLLIADGHIRDGWMYLQPLGEPETVGPLLNQCEITDDNVDDLIEVAVAEGNAPELGFRLVLDRYGTCNAITTFDSYMTPQTLAARRPVASLLVKHLYQELSDNVNRQLDQRTGGKRRSKKLGDLTKQHPELFIDGGHHIDTTHLASIVRIARILDDPSAIELAIELTEYGQSLTSDFKVAEDPPFNDLYQHSEEFLRVLAGQDANARVEQIEKRARAADRAQYGTAPMEWLVYLLHQIGQTRQALTVFVENVSADDVLLGIAPSLFALCEQLGDWDPAREYFQRSGDLLNYSIACLHQNDG